MKNRLYFLCFLLLFTLSSCNEKITCVITSLTAVDTVFFENQTIPVTVEASTNKGSIIQVQILVDDEVIQSFIASPYHYSIPPYTLPIGFHSITAEAYSSGNNVEIAGRLIKIKK